MSVKLLTAYNLEFLSLKRDYTGSSGSSLVKMPHCWKSHVTAQMWKCQIRENCCCKPLKTLLLVIIRLLAHLSRRLWGELIGRDSSWRPCVCPCVHSFTLSNIYISDTSNLNVIKFHQEHQWGGGKAALCFGPDWTRTLVSLATDSTHRVIMGKIL